MVGGWTGGRDRGKKGWRQAGRGREDGKQEEAGGEHQVRFKTRQEMAYVVTPVRPQDKASQNQIGPGEDGKTPAEALQPQPANDSKESANKKPHLNSDKSTENET